MASTMITCTLLPLTGAEPLVVEAPLILWFGLS
jgi:hypothetical protein